MVEYASVRSSLYDIDALVSQLNERAGDGWEVVQILPTGGDVTAVLKRSPDAETAAVEETDDSPVAVAPVTLYDTGEYQVVTADEVVDDAGDEVVAVEETVVDVVEVPEEVAVTVDEAAAEPPGWAVAPVAVEETVTVTETVDEAEPDAPTEVTAVVAEPVVPDAPEPPVEAAAVAAAATPPPAATPEPTPAPAPPPAPAPAAAPSIPPGWYPDPSSRFELRYWDGSAWTEHVARAGQMYTDPPVA